MGGKYDYLIVGAGLWVSMYAILQLSKVSVVW